MKKSLSLCMSVCLLFASAEVVSAPIIKIIGAMDGANGQFDLAKPNYDMAELNITTEDLSGAECRNIAGKWHVSESGTVICYHGDVETFPLGGSGTVDILQNGCDISYLTPNDNVLRSGDMRGNKIYLSGKLVVPITPTFALPDGNVFTLTGTVNEENQFTLNGAGFAAFGANGIIYQCRGESTVEFSRNTTTINNIECLLNWAENAYPNLFSPAGAISQLQSPYTYRYYSYTNSYVGVSTINSHVYYLGPDGVLQDVGPLSNWLPLTDCQ